ncbi:MAG: indolepyruvate oxidoreductase subunit beta family protein [Burkholderiaceae bacterium]
MKQQPISILLCALGGEGGGVLSEWLVDSARHAGYAAQATSIPGVAQRTGATTYYLEIFPVPLAELGGKRPVFGLNPLPGRLDVLVSSELLETARQIGNGLSSNQHTLVITSSSRALTTIEKMQLGDGRREEQDLLQLVGQHSRAHHVLDMAQLTAQAGTVVSAVMLGCIAGSGVLPFSSAACEATIASIGGHAKASLKGFSLGFEAVSAQRSQAVFVENLLSDSDPTTSTPAELPSPIAALFPPPLHNLLALGYARMLDYQDADYAQTYVERLQQVLQAEQAADPAAANGYSISLEMIRWLALWMAFDDIVRVADLKSRPSRLQRVQGEVKPKPGDVLQVYEHFKPGVPELAALLSPGWANKLLAWERRRITQGKPAWALPIKVGSHSVLGMISLRLLASLKWLRRKGSRFALEQTMISQWLDAVLSATRRNWQVGHEIAQCGRLIKGYGSTNERGKDNLLHVLQHLAQAAHFTNEDQRAAAISAARQAALTDEAGKALDLALTQHGAPARPIQPQPIRWMKNPRLSKPI